MTWHRRDDDLDVRARFEMILCGVIASRLCVDPAYAWDVLKGRSKSHRVQNAFLELFRELESAIDRQMANEPIPQNPFRHRAERIEREMIQHKAEGAA